MINPKLKDLSSFDGTPPTQNLIIQKFEKTAENFNGSASPKELSISINGKNSDKGSPQFDMYDEYDCDYSNESSGTKPWDEPRGDELNQEEDREKVIVCRISEAEEEGDSGGIGIIGGAMESSGAAERHRQPIEESNSSSMTTDLWEKAAAAGNGMSGDDEIPRPNTPNIEPKMTLNGCVGGAERPSKPKSSEKISFGAGIVPPLQLGQIETIGDSEAVAVETPEKMSITGTFDKMEENLDPNTEDKSQKQQNKEISFSDKNSRSLEPSEFVGISGHLDNLHSTIAEESRFDLSRFRSFNPQTFRNEVSKIRSEPLDTEAIKDIAILHESANPGILTTHQIDISAMEPQIQNKISICQGSSPDDSEPTDQPDQPLFTSDEPTELSNCQEIENGGSDDFFLGADKTAIRDVKIYLINALKRKKGKDSVSKILAPRITFSRQSGSEWAQSPPTQPKKRKANARSFKTSMEGSMESLNLKNNLESVFESQPQTARNPINPYQLSIETDPKRPPNSHRVRLADENARNSEKKGSFFLKKNFKFSSKRRVIKNRSDQFSSILTRVQLLKDFSKDSIPKISFIEKNKAAVKSAKIRCKYCKRKIQKLHYGVHVKKCKSKFHELSPLTKLKAARSQNKGSNRKSKRAVKSFRKSGRGKESFTGEGRPVFLKEVTCGGLSASYGISDLFDLSSPHHPSFLVNGSRKRRNRKKLSLR